MGTNKIDQLFREKLDAHQSTPDIQAWGDLEQMIDKKNKKVVFWYYKIAASILLFLTIGFSSYQLLKPNGQKVLADLENTEPVSIPQDEFKREETVSEPLVKVDKKIDQSNLTATVEKLTPKKLQQTGSDENVKENQEKEVQYVAVVGDEDEIQQLALQEDAQVFELDEFLLVDSNEAELLKPILEQEELIDADQTSKKPKVRITYKTAPKKHKKRRVVIIAKLDTMRRWKPDFKNILKAPGNFLADVREAKDFLFNPNDDLIETENIP